jgi:hypothetical protein
VNEGGPTACPSAAASAPQKLPKNQRSRARSGRLHGRVRQAGSSFRSAARMTVSHLHGTTRHTGRSLEPHPAQNHTSTTDRQKRSPCPKRAVCTGGHNERSAPRAFIPRQHHEHWHDASGTTGTRHSDELYTKTGLRPHCPAAERPAFSRRERATRSHSSSNDLARAAVGLECIVGPLIVVAQDVYPSIRR